jgi:cytochrome bd ubiquinol oxidase subunit II
MLAGLILRGVAFEYRNKTERMRWIWDLSRSMVNTTATRHGQNARSAG